MPKAVDSTVGQLIRGETVNNVIRNLNIHPPADTRTKSSKIGDFHFPKLVKSFRGRDSELTQLMTWFFEEGESMVAICGLPGYGKTELAKHFTYQCRDKKLLKTILWINSETTDSLENSFRELLKWLGDNSDLDIISVVQRVHQELNAESNMFVFDNAQDLRSVSNFEPSGKARCLVTSHVKDWGDEIHSLNLMPLSPDGALAVLSAVLRNRFNPAHKELYEKLAETLSCVPLALQVAAAYVRQEMCDHKEDFCLQEYVQALQYSCEELIKKDMPGFSANPYRISIYQAVSKSLSKINNLNNVKLAWNILHICAYLNPDKIFTFDLKKIPYIHNLLSNDKDLNRALSILQNYSFIQVTEDQIFIHRLIQDTLILYQINHNENNHNQFYFACLESLLLNINTNHRDFILKYAEKHVETFLHFYITHNLDIVSKNIFFNHLIAVGHEVFLNQIFDHLAMSGKDTNVINEHLLVHEAVRCKQYGVLELLLARGAFVDVVNERRDTPLFVAADLLDKRAVKILTKHKADVNAINAGGDFVLHRVIGALARPQHVSKVKTVYKMLQLLKDHDACIEVLDLQGGTLLHSAAWVLSADLVNFLVGKFHLEVNKPDFNRQTPLYYVSKGWIADKGRRLRTAKSLLELGAKIEVRDDWNQTPAQHARSLSLDYLARYFENPSNEHLENHTPQAEAYVLISLLATGETTSLIRKLDEFGEKAAEKINEYCLLHEAVRRGQLSVIELLLARGANVDSRNDRHDTPLLVAARELDLLAVEELVRRGADVNAANSAGKSVLHALVIALGRPKQADRQDEVCAVLRKLAKRGACTSVTTPDGESLLHYAAYALLTDVIHFLIREFRLDVNAVNKDGQTPLFYIAFGLEHWHRDESWGISTAAYLTVHDARLDIVDSDGLTPYKNAHNRKFKGLAKYLKIPTEQQQTNNDKNSSTNTATDIEIHRPSTILVTPSTQQQQLNTVPDTTNTESNTSSTEEETQQQVDINKNTAQNSIPDLEFPSPETVAHQIELTYRKTQNKKQKIALLADISHQEQLNTVPDGKNTDFETSSSGGEIQQQVDTDKNTQNTISELESHSIENDADQPNTETVDTKTELITPTEDALLQPPGADTDTKTPEANTQLESPEENASQPVTSDSITDTETSKTNIQLKSPSEEDEHPPGADTDTETLKTSTPLESPLEANKILHPLGADMDTKTPEANPQLESAEEYASQQPPDTITDAVTSKTNIQLNSPSEVDEHPPGADMDTKTAEANTQLESLEEDASQQPPDTITDTVTSKTNIQLKSPSEVDEHPLGVDTETPKTSTEIKPSSEGDASQKPPDTVTNTETMKTYMEREESPSEKNEKYQNPQRQKPKAEASKCRPDPDT